MHAILTEHAFERCKERCGWNAEAAQRMADKALEKGLQHSETSGRLKRYLDGLYMAERTANNMRIYGAHVYLFKDSKLITVLHLEHRFQFAASKLIARKQ